MSTTFAIKIKNKKVNVALRHNGGRIEITNNLLRIIDRKRRVYAIDNTPQGVQTVGDILDKEDLTSAKKWNEKT